MAQPINSALIPQVKWADMAVNWNASDDEMSMEIDVDRKQIDNFLCGDEFDHVILRFWFTFSHKPIPLHLLACYERGGETTAG